jgi:glycosyltransferase involved in cell wall biosynthesis
MLKVLAIVGGINACSDLGIASPLCLLEKRGEVSFKLTTASSAKIGDIKKADIVIFQRNLEKIDRLIFDFAQHLRKKIIYDIDDFLIELPRHLGELADFHNAPERVANIKYFLNKSNVVKAGSPALANALKPYANNNVVVFSYPNVDEYYQPIKHSTDGILRFVVVVSPDMLIFLKNGLLKVIERILYEYRGKVKFVFLGVDDAFCFVDADVKCYPQLPFLQYIELFSTLNADAGLVYLKDDFFARCKTNNKFREFAARGIAGIYNDISVYADCVISGKTGVVVQGSTHEYYLAMKNFLENPDSAKKIGCFARAFAEENYRMEFYANDWLIEIQRLCSDKTEHTGFFQQCVFSGRLYCALLIIKNMHWFKNSLFYVFFDVCRNQGFFVAMSKLGKFAKRKFLRT